MAGRTELNAHGRSWWPLKTGPLAAAEPPNWVRWLLAVEMLLVLAAINGSIWLQPDKGGLLLWYHFALGGAAVLLPVLSNILHGDGMRDSGLRLDNFWSSLAEALAATLAMGFVVGKLGGILGGFERVVLQITGELAMTYFPVALLQQYLLQACLLRRLRHAGLSDGMAIFAAAGLFAGLHAPNWILVTVTFAGAVVWCWLFLGRPNLWTLAISHGVLALVTYHAIPWKLHLGMSVGPRFLERVAKYLM